MNIAYKESSEGSQPLIAFHGWLDNANSFLPLSKYLDPEIKLYLIDLPGHGYSESIKPGSEYTITQSIQQMIGIIDALKIESFHLVGHSLGSALASLLAGTVPNKIRTLTLVEGLGPYSSPESELPEIILKNYKAKEKKVFSQKPIYSSITQAARDRQQKTSLPLELCTILAERGLKKVNENQYTWLSDPRLLLPSIHPLSEEGVHAFLRTITAPTLEITASNGLNMHEIALNARRSCLAHHKSVQLPGSHHVHMELPKKLAELINCHIKSV